MKVLSTVRTAVKTMLGAALWVLGIASVSLLLALGVGPRTGRYRTLTVLSGSMRPGIPVGAVVVATPEPASRLRVGQVIAYNIPVDDHHVVSHRVVQIIKGGARPVFKTKGDANNAPDTWTAQVTGDTVWRVRMVVPEVGLVIHALRDPTLHLVSVIVVPVALALVWLVAIWREAPSDSDDAPVTPVSLRRRLTARARGRLPVWTTVSVQAAAVLLSRVP